MVALDIQGGKDRSPRKAVLYPACLVFSTSSRKVLSKIQYRVFAHSFLEEYTQLFEMKQTTGIHF